MPIRASTSAPISRAGTEYVLCFTWMVLPRRTRTRSRSSVSKRPSGNGRIRAISAATFAVRPALRCSRTPTRNCQYSSRLRKSRLPRNNNPCSTAVLK
jgi:hypothetical protein